MKTTTKLILAGLATAFFATGSAFAGDSSSHFINKNHRPVQSRTTVAVSTQGQGIGTETKMVYREVDTGNGIVGFWAPAQ